MTYKISVRQGDTFAFTVTYKSGGAVVNLTGYTAEMVFSWPLTRFSNRAQINADEVNLSMGALGASGIITASLSAAQTALLPLGTNMVYQLRIRVSDDPVITLISGAVDVSADLFELVV